MCGGNAPSGQVLGAGPDPQPSQRSPELALALASGYQHDPEQLLDMQQALFDALDTETPAGKKPRSRSAEPGLFLNRMQTNIHIPTCAGGTSRAMLQFF